MKRIMNINVFRRCLDCGYEQFELEEVKIGDDNQWTSRGFIVCPKCNGRHFALVGYRDRRKAPKDMNLPIVFGRTSNGEIVIRDLVRLPHLLIGGLTGFGKSVFLNSLICSLVQDNPPEHIRFVLMDPKMVEFGCYGRLPHLDAAIVSDPEECVAALERIGAETDRRRAILSRQECKDIESFWGKGEGVGMPCIVVVIDEFSDLLMDRFSGCPIVCKDRFEAAIRHITSSGVYCGVHLIIATSRPCSKLLSPSLKSNFQSRLCFRVSCENDSRTILDESGAQNLSGRGSALLKIRNDRLSRIQSPSLSDEKKEEIVRSAMERYPARVPPPRERSVGALGDEVLLGRAREVLEMADHVSIGRLQQELNIGYNKALRLIVLLEDSGIIRRRGR